MAAAAGHLEVCEMLLGAGVELKTLCLAGRTPLLTACVAGHTAVVEALVAVKADYEAVEETPDVDGVVSRKPGRNAFQILAAESSEQHASCIRGLVRLLTSLDPGKLVQLLEDAVEATSRRQSCTYRALARALPEARKRCKSGRLTH